MQRYENRVFDEFDNKTIISIPDRELISHPGKENIHIIPNGVDHEFFRPSNAEKHYELVFTGNMAYPPNVDAAYFLVNEVMPRIWKVKPNAKLMLAGGHAKSESKVISIG